MSKSMFVVAERRLSAAEPLVGGHHLGWGEVGSLDAGADDVKAVERCLFGDAFLMAGKGEAVVVDLQDEMFGHLVFVGDPADAKWSSPFSRTG